MAGDRMADQKPGLELCAGTYRAEKVPGMVLVFADGIHPTSGYQTFLAEDSPPPVVAARLSLWHVRPTGPVMNVTTPFSVCASFQTTRDFETVSIRDALGIHAVPVRPARAECGVAVDAR